MSQNGTRSGDLPLASSVVELLGHRNVGAGFELVRIEVDDAAGILGSAAGGAGSDGARVSALETRATAIEGDVETLTETVSTRDNRLAAVELGIAEALDTGGAQEAVLQYRPGDAPQLYTQTVGGGPATLKAAVAPGRIASSNATGNVVALPGGESLASRIAFPVGRELNHYIRFDLRRTTSPADPSGDTVRCAILWLSAGLLPLAGATTTQIINATTLATTIVRDITTLAVDPNPDPIEALISPTVAGAINPPLGAVYFIPFIHSFGAGSVTEVTEIARRDHAWGTSAGGDGIGFDAVGSSGDDRALYDGEAEGFSFACPDAADPLSLIFFVHGEDPGEWRGPFAVRGRPGEKGEPGPTGAVRIYSNYDAMQAAAPTFDANVAVEFYDPAVPLDARRGIYLKSGGIGTGTFTFNRPLPNEEVASRLTGLDEKTDLNRSLALYADDDETRVTAGHAIWLAESLLTRVRALEKQIIEGTEANMTVYPIAVTATGAASIIVAAGSNVQRLQVQNRSATERAAVAFGTAPASIEASGVYLLEPGQSLDTSLIPALPIYIVAEESAPISGAFSVPTGEPNWNWETDFQAVVTAMGGVRPSFAFEAAYRGLYSETRRLGVLSKSRGFFPLAAHHGTAALVNWADPTVLMTANGAPAFTVAQGFTYDGVDDFHNTNKAISGFTTSADLSGFVWVGTEDQATGKIAVGDGALTLEPNRSPTTAAIRSGTTQADQFAIPALGSMIGFSRRLDDRATLFSRGGVATTVSRARITSYPNRTMAIGANNSSVGAADFYAGRIRLVQFGKALTDREVFAMEAAVNTYFKAITSLTA